MLKNGVAGLIVDGVLDANVSAGEIEETSSPGLRWSRGVSTWDVVCLGEPNME